METLIPGFFVEYCRRVLASFSPSGHLLKFNGELLSSVEDRSSEDVFKAIGVPQILIDGIPVDPVEIPAQAVFFWHKILVLFAECRNVDLEKRSGKRTRRFPAVSERDLGDAMELLKRKLSEYEISCPLPRYSLENTLLLPEIISDLNRSLILGNPVLAAVPKKPQCVVIPSEDVMNSRLRRGMNISVFGESSLLNDGFTTAFRSTEILFAEDAEQTLLGAILCPHLLLICAEGIPSVPDYTLDHLRLKFGGDLEVLFIRNRGNTCPGFAFANHFVGVPESEMALQMPASPEEGSERDWQKFGIIPPARTCSAPNLSIMKSKWSLYRKWMARGTFSHPSSSIPSPVIQAKERLNHLFVRVAIGCPPYPDPIPLSNPRPVIVPDLSPPKKNTASNSALSNAILVFQGGECLELLDNWEPGVLPPHISEKKRCYRIIHARTALDALQTLFWTPIPGDDVFPADLLDGQDAIREFVAAFVEALLIAAQEAHLRDFELLHMLAPASRAHSGSSYDDFIGIIETYTQTLAEAIKLRGLGARSIGDRLRGLLPEGSRAFPPLNITVRAPPPWSAKRKPKPPSRMT